MLNVQFALYLLGNRKMRRLVLLCRCLEPHRDWFTTSILIHSLLPSLWSPSQIPPQLQLVKSSARSWPEVPHSTSWPLLICQIFSILALHPAPSDPPPPSTSLCLYPASAASFQPCCSRHWNHHTRHTDIGFFRLFKSWLKTLNWLTSSN